MDGMPIYASAGQHGTSTYSNTVPVTTWIHEEITPMILSAINDIPYTTSDGPFTICDYGTADGGVSLPLMKKCVDSVRSLHGQETEILLVYNDLPTNDFESLAQNIYVAANVYTSIVAKSFYEQCCPTGSVHLGFSVMAILWLSRRPAAVKDAVHFLLSDDEEVISMFSEQAARDWENFLRCRAKEIISGGHLFVDLCAKGPAFFRAYEALNKAWLSMLSTKRISDEEHHRATIATYFRSPEEYMHPFATHNSVGRRAGFVVVSAEDKNTTLGFHRFWQRYNNDRTTELQKFSSSVVASIQAWSQTAFLYALASSRTQEEKEEIISEFYLRLTDLVARDAEEFSKLENCSGRILLQKQ